MLEILVFAWCGLCEAADQGFGAVGDVGMERQDCFGPDDTFDAEDLAEGGLQIVRIGGHNPAPHIAPAGNLVDLQNLGQQPQGAHHSVQLPVCHFDRDESDDVVPHRREVNLAPAIVQHTSTEQAPDARLSRVACDPQQLAEFPDLDTGIADELQQYLQVGGVKSIQTVTFGYAWHSKLRILLNSTTSGGFIRQEWFIIWVSMYTTGGASHKDPRPGKCQGNANDCLQ
jgi:hypothetical protein